MDIEQARGIVEASWVAHHGAVRDYLYRMSRNTHLTEDLTAEAYVRMLRHLTKPDAEAPTNTMAWLRTVARNLLLDHFRSGQNRFEMVTEMPLLDVVQASDPFVDVEMWETALRLLAMLPEKQRAVVILRGLRDMSVAETATAMGVTEQAVRSLRHAAKRRLAAEREVIEILNGATETARPSGTGHPGGSRDDEAQEAAL